MSVGMGNKGGKEVRSFSVMIERILVLSFVITLAVEMIAGWLWGIRSKSGIYVIFLVNLITNPLLVTAKICCSVFLPIETVKLLMFLAEICAVWPAEGFLYSKRLYGCRHPYLFAAAANVLSYGAGILLSR